VVYGEKAKKAALSGRPCIDVHFVMKLLVKILYVMGGRP